LALTPREFQALVDRYKDEQDWLNYRSALIASIIASASTGKEFQPKEFMPDNFKESTVIQTSDQMAAQLKAITLLTGGKVETKHV